MAGIGYCQYEFAGDWCDNKDSCTNKIEVREDSLLQKYKSKLLSHLLWEAENEELLERTELMLFKLHLSNNRK